MQERESFNSEFGLILAAVGSAIGLGNIWRFPYLVGENGGVFVFLYLAFVFILGMPIFISELTIGRRTKLNAVAAFRQLAGKSIMGKAGYLQVIACAFVLSFYCVVGGWTIYYFYLSLNFTLIGLHAAELQKVFADFTSSPLPHISVILIFMLIAVLIVIGGVQKGIERICKILMPVLLILIIILMIRSLTLEGANAGLEFLFYPDFSKLDSHLLSVALGQALFSLSIGCGILTYGSYMRKQDDIIKSSKYVVFSDTIFSFIAVLAIMPAVFALGFEPTEGPGLVFIVFPEIFSQIVGGTILQILFFFALIIAAVTSAISLLETPVAYVLEEWKLTRKTATIIVSTAITIVGCFAALSLARDSNLVFLNHNLFDIISDAASNIIIPLSAAAVAILIGWKLKKSDFLDELTNANTIKINAFNFLIFILKYIAPLALLVILIGGILNYYRIG